MKRIFTPTFSGSDWQHLLAKPTLHWKKGFSAMSAAAAWEAAGDKLPPEISRALNSSYVPEVRGLNLLAALPEWEVPLPGGDRASFTDVLAICRNTDGVSVLAVEAKADEDFGPVVGDKLKEATPGQQERLSYLQNMLSLKTLDPEIRYQLLHRTASALLAAEEFCASTAIMMIHSFGKRPELRADFDRFCEAMHAEEVGSGVFQVKHFDRPRLILVWVNGDPKHAATELDWDPRYDHTRGAGNPKETVRILDELQSLGFDDEAFALLHHFRLEGRSETIARMRDYCLKTDRFQPGGTNEEMQKRLKLVLAAYKRGGFRSVAPEVWKALAEAAWAEIPGEHAHEDGKVI